MANTKYILSQIRLEGELQDLIAKSDGENVSVNYHGTDMTLASALAEIFTSISSTESVDEKISAAINDLINGAPETYDTLKEIADYIATHQDAADALSAAIGNKVDKEEGKGLSTEDFTTLLKNKLDHMPEITAEQVEGWNKIRGVRYGTETPDDMQDGELFVRVVSEE